MPGQSEGRPSVQYVKLCIDVARGETDGTHGVITNHTLKIPHSLHRMPPIALFLWQFR